MNAVYQLNSQAMEESVLARNIILNDGEDNHWDDSDFFHVYLDRVENKLVKFYTGSTRHGGSSELENAADIRHMNDQLQEYFWSKAKEAAKAQVLATVIGSGAHNARSGDTVKVTNPSARKNKGVEIKLHHRSEYCDNFGRVQSVYLHAEDGTKLIEHNCTVTAVSESRLNDLIENLLVGIRL